MTKLLNIIRGIPGTGKTTYATFQAIKSGGIVAEADQFMVDEKGNYAFDPNRLPEVHALCQAKVRQAMKASVNNIYLSNTSSQYWEIEPYIKMAKEFGYKINLIELKNYYGSIHNVPVSSIQAMLNRWEDQKSIAKKIKAIDTKLLYGFKVINRFFLPKGQGNLLVQLQEDHLIIKGMSSDSPSEDNPIIVDLGFTTEIKVYYDITTDLLFPGEYEEEFRVYVKIFNGNFEEEFDVDLDLSFDYIEREIGDKFEYEIEKDKLYVLIDVDLLC